LAWNSKIKLTKEQIDYAMTDVYATQLVFLALDVMPWIDPFKSTNLK
jgi:hypothetical protein